jgi:uncharacterized protein YegL
MPIAINTTPTTTHLALLIDSSGSMRGLDTKVVKNVNNILEALQTKASELGQKVLVSLYSFGGTVDPLLLRQPIDRPPRLKASDYIASGTTPMVQALNRAIADLEAVDGKDIANLVTIVTDGEGDFDYGQETLNTKMGKLTGNDRWTFSFLIPRGNTYHINSRFRSVPAGNIQEWDTTEKGLEVGSQAMASGYASYLGLRSTGATKSTGFFTAAVSTQQAQAAKQNLNDVRKDFKELTVRTQDPKTLQEFIEARSLTFSKGKSFYQLSKTEKVQPEKEILLRECATGAVYGGAQARGILGLPVGVEVKVKPADHGTWDVFVQSTSNNRKLMPGTNLLYLK